jgi:hypothetical protein
LTYKASLAYFCSAKESFYFHPIFPLYQSEFSSVIISRGDNHLVINLFTEGGLLAMNTSVFSSHRRFLFMLTAFALGFALVACGGGNKKKDKAAEEKGSLSRTYKIVDEQGRNSGTLTLDPAGGAELRDADGNLLRKFSPPGAPAEVKPAEVKPEEAPATQ